MVVRSNTACDYCVCSSAPCRAQWCAAFRGRTLIPAEAARAEARAEAAWARAEALEAWEEAEEEAEAARAEARARARARARDGRGGKK
jgi:hypothetical protein